MRYFDYLQDKDKPTEHSNYSKTIQEELEYQKVSSTLYVQLCVVWTRQPTHPTGSPKHYNSHW